MLCELFDVEVGHYLAMLCFLLLLTLLATCYIVDILMRTTLHVINTAYLHDTLLMMIHITGFTTVFKP